MKYYEYLAAGLSVLATSTQALRERSSAQTFLYEGVAEVSRLSELALAASTPNKEGMREALTQDWAAKTELLIAFLRNL
jgi:teichuronic acid biosynthesis glycosyltransferase TuaH